MYYILRLHFQIGKYNFITAKIIKNSITNLFVAFGVLIIFLSNFSQPERFYDWESLRTPNPNIPSTIDKKAVVSECGNLVVNNLRTIALESLLTIATPRDLEVYIPPHHNIELKQLKKDIAYLMVGIESHSFPFSTKKNSFLPRKGLSADGVTPEALESFSTPFMTCGNLMRKLSVLIEIPSGRGAIYEAFIYGVKNFVKMYQNLVLSLETSQNGGRFFQLARQLMKHVLFVTKLCNVDQSQSGEDKYLSVPKGMDLLLYVLNRTRHISQTDLELLSISILRATINPYLNFLSSWLFHGKCNQDDIEFGIQSNERFLSSKDRGFWLNAYTSVYDQLPIPQQTHDRPLDIIYITTKVVACGKALNLLRICCPSHPLCIDGIKFRSKLDIAVTPSQEKDLRLKCLGYMTNMTEKMQKSHLLLEQERKIKATKKNSISNNRPRTPEKAENKPISTSCKAQPQTVTDKSKEPLNETERLLPEKDESERIAAIKSDLISFYNNEKPNKIGEQPKLTSNEISSNSITEKTVIEANKKDSTQKDCKENASIESCATENDIATKDETKQSDKFKGELLPSKIIVEASKESKNKNDKKFKVPTAQSIISQKVRKTPKDLLPINTVDENIHTSDLEVPKYAFEAVNTRAAKLYDRCEIPSSTKGLAPLELLVRNSIQIPLMTQLTLINSEILHYFLINENLYKNLEAISNYLLLKDNEFAFNLGVGLSDAIDEDTQTFQKHPTTLSRILRNAISSSSSASVDPLASNVGFCVNQIVKGQQHCSDILDMLKLSYSVEWPLNIIITPDMIDSYGQIFQLLLRMENVSITLNKTFMQLKQHRYLFRDYRFVQVEVIRHRMLNYITIIKAYIRNQIVVACWQDFEADLKTNVNCLDTLWNAHFKYVNKLLSRAFLYKETQPIRNILMKTLDTINTFTRYIQQPNFIDSDGDSTYVNNELYEKIKTTYNTFHHLLSLFTSIVSKLETKGYKFHLQELLACLRIASACGTTSKI